jgi:hypothetical protein
LSHIFSIIKIPFKTIENKIDKNHTYLHSLRKNLEMAEINIGEPIQTIKLHIGTSYYHFIIANSKKKIKDIYSNSSSKTSSIISNKKKFFSYNNYYNGYLCEDSLILQNEKGKKISYKNFPFFIAEYDNQNSGLIGLNLIKERNSDDLNFIKILKEKKIISSLIFLIKFNKDKKNGELIIGDYPHKYNKNYKENSLKFTKIEKNRYTTNWQIQFDNIKYDNISSSQSLSKYADIVIEFGLIRAPNEYKDLVFKKLNISNNCNEIHDEFGSSYVYCDKNTNIKLLPSLNFFHKEFNFTFTLNYQDLFLEKDDKYCLLVIFNHIHGFQEWTLGKPFMTKYEFIFDTEKTTIGFYTNFKDSSSSIGFKIIIVFIIIIIGLIYFINQILKLKRRKARKNEIEEVFDYIPAGKNGLGF